MSNQKNILILTSQTGGGHNSLAEALRDLLESGTLRNYAEEVLARAYGRAVQQAATEMGIPVGTLKRRLAEALNQLTRNGKLRQLVGAMNHLVASGTAHFEPCKLLARMAGAGEKFYPKN